MTEEFSISVVVPCVNALSDFRTCATALLAQTGPRPEIIAVERLGPDFARSLKDEFPDARVISVPEDSTIPMMRAVGIRAARTDTIGVIEDHVVVPADWTTLMLDEIAAGSDVVAGPVDNMATETLIDWAAFICEYSAVLPPLASGPSDWLPGNNTVYRRDTLRQYDDLLQPDQWENLLHHGMREGGARLTLRNDAVAGHKMHYSFWLYFSQRFLYSKSFAGARTRDASPMQRLLMGGMAFALPPVVFYRVVRNILRKKRHVNQLIRSLPLLVPFSLSWGAGEVAGYWFGAGKSLSRVR